MEGYLALAGQISSDFMDFFVAYSVTLAVLLGAAVFFFGKNNNKRWPR